MSTERGVTETHTDNLEARLTVVPTQIYLSSSDKHLILSINNHLSTAATDVKKIKSRCKQPGSTTLVYRRAREIMEDAASILKTYINYKFQTSNFNMINWALNTEKGMAIFDWDNWYEEDGHFLALKAIYPRSLKFEKSPN